MRRLVSGSSLLRQVIFAVFFALAFTFLGENALAQHVAMRPAVVPHASAPHVFAPHVFAPGVNSPSAIRLTRPIFPTFANRHFGFHGAPFFGVGMGLRFSSMLGPNCGPFLSWAWAWAYSCYALPVYVYEGDGRDLPQLYTKDGTVYNVTDYWVVDNQLHFTTIDQSGAQWDEHTIAFDELDLQKTVDVSKQRGFHFLLRNEPLQQYLRDHPEIGAPGDAPPKSVKP
jgi:hypothetical protein